MNNEELCAVIQAGERDKLQTLWEQCEKFVDMMAGRYCRLLAGRLPVEQADLYQSGFIALVDAADSFDINGGGNFITWLAYHLKRAFGDTAGIRSKAGQRFFNAVSLNAPLDVYDTESGTLLDTVPDERAPIDELIERLYIEELGEVLRGMVEELPIDEATAINAKYFDGLTGAALTAAAGEDSTQVYKSLNKGLANLRKMLHTTPLGRKLRSFSERMPYQNQHVSPDTFLRTHTSAVELAVIRREAEEFKAWREAPLCEFTCEEARILDAYRQELPELDELAKKYVKKHKKQASGQR